ncbi:DsbA family oxidoreductase [Terrimonas sp. NA20]|uniref:DsbA family oxidoreductase n=1 Tax=Terrimonas ginsenosidimutans TaxID=2908004 RepID=A0ABS9KRL6_9BACT|nr:DsbA family oxidoreductase [Terrimonas ginsenosidimutans]MCG2614973.1 DsbA family oxidoreductase [Terrimonas ginsenosidimutans]
MKIEIWSDIMCPFCYIGKRHFEKALENFEGKDDVQVEWKSFQLNPDMKTEPGKSINEYLAEHKGWSIEQARQANQYVTGMAAKAGLTYDMERAVVANSFDAHRLIQLAKASGRGDEMEERLFKAYFTEGKNIGDPGTLAELAADAGLDKQRAEEVLKGREFAEAVDRDIYEAQQIRVSGVPFFVLNDRYAVSGAQPAETFAGALEQAWKEWKQESPAIQTLSENTGDTCQVDGNC